MLGDRIHRRTMADLVSTAGLVAGTAIACGLAGCSTTASPGINNGLAAMNPGDDAAGGDGDAVELSETEIADSMARSMSALEDFFENNDTAPARIAAADPDEQPVEEPAIPVEAPPVTADDPIDVADAEAEPEGVSPEERARALAADLEAVLRETTDDPYTLAIRLAGLLAGEPDASARLDALAETLPAEQRGVVLAVAAILGEAGTDPASMTEALVARAEELDEARPVRIGHLALCSRVEGFGRFNELASTGFVAGSPMRMIVYTEVEHFDRTEIGRSSGSRSDGGIAVEDGWEVRLSQELLLYHESDGLLAWRRPEEVTSYRSRSKPRDYFIVDQITLPRSLTVGAYRLKVVLRDLADRSVDERIIPIRVVADPALAGATPTRYGG